MVIIICKRADGEAEVAEDGRHGGPGRGGTHGGASSMMKEISQIYSLNNSGILMTMHLTS